MKDWHDHSFDELFRRLNLKAHQVPKTDYGTYGKYPIVDQGKELIAGYTDEGTPVTNLPVIVFGDHTRVVKWITHPFIVGADGTQPLQTTDLCDPHFGYFLLSNTRIRDLGYSRHFSELKEHAFFLPDSLPEQRKIAAVLGAWDRGIEKLQALVTAKTERLRVLREHLLTGTRRFPKFGRGKWRRVQLGDVLEHVFRPVEWAPDHLFRLISIRRRCGGLFRRGDLLGADYKTTDLHEVRSGDYLISKRQVVHGAWGMVTDEFAGCHVSKEYSILVNRAPGVLHMPFFDWLCHQRRMWHLAFLASDGVHLEKLIFDSKDFLKHHIQLPPTIEEQQRIVSVLDACDHEIRLLETELAALKLQKRGLMQKLLTGEVRVKAGKTGKE